MSKPELVMVAPLPTLAEVEADFVVHRLWEAPDRDAFLAKVAPTARGIVTTGVHGADAALMDTLPKAEVVAIFGVGFDAVDLDHAKRRGIVVTNTPEVLTDDVADLALALALALCRRLVGADQFVRAGNWKPGRNVPLARKFAGSKVGILGLGRIGAAVARRVAGFDCETHYSDVAKRTDLPHQFHADAVSLAKAVEILMVTTAGGATTRNLVDAAVLEALGPDGLVVNVSRGSVIDEPALVAALVEKRIGGAALDVFAAEPHVPPELIGMDNVVVLPHIASATHQTRRAMGDLVLKNLRAHFAGEKHPTRVV